MAIFPDISEPIEFAANRDVDVDAELNLAPLYFNGNDKPVSLLTLDVGIENLRHGLFGIQKMLKDNHDQTLEPLAYVINVILGDMECTLDELEPYKDKNKKPLFCNCWTTPPSLEIREESTNA